MFCVILKVNQNSSCIYAIITFYRNLTVECRVFELYFRSTLTKTTLLCLKFEEKIKFINFIFLEMSLRNKKYSPDIFTSNNFQ
jgi:hypothetical protein